MADDLAFLHTAAVHIATFDRLVNEIAPDMRVHHLVNEQLLEEARRDGADSPALASRIASAIADAASGGAELVVCTCSTIGGAAEAAPHSPKIAVLRVDRAMAECAVRFGARVLVVAALHSTAEPTCALLGSCARAINLPLQVRTLIVDNAWDAFTSADTTTYLRLITDAVQSHLADADVVVLAQASMAAVAEQLAHLPVPVLSSPALGVRDAVARVHARRQPAQSDAAH